MSVSLGIDIGGSSIKYGLVSKSDSFNLITVKSLETPKPATPEVLAECVSQIVSEHKSNCVGIAFPAVVRGGIVHTAAHVDPAWVNVDGKAVFGAKIPHLKALLNDADAALLAEREWGACRGFSGAVLMLTLGTGIGSAMMVDGVLWPNSELGHTYLAQGLEAEQWAAASIKIKEQLSWESWGRRLNAVLREMQRLCHPDLMVLGGGVSESFDAYAAFLDVPIPIIPSALGNRAGVAGAALAGLIAPES